MASEKTSPLEFVRELFAKKGLDGLWKWAVVPDGAHSKAKRFRILEIFAGNQRDQERPDSPAHKKWAQVRQEYAEQRDKYERRYKSREKVTWPAHLPIAECLYHNPPHFHLASSDPNALLQVLRVLERGFNLRISEHTAWEDVEPVHTAGSWHYRVLRNGQVIVVPVSTLKYGTALNLAADINDLDGGSDQEYAAYIEVRRRYA